MPERIFIYFREKLITMTKAEELFHKIASELPDVVESKMFGAMCIKAPNGKAGVMFQNDDMIFKLEGDNLDEAMKLKDAKIFSPGGRAMTGWVQLEPAHSAKWKKYAEIAMENAAKIVVEKKKPAEKKKVVEKKKK